jgi:8-hydroxy-5-deazaflavin:NADPH oxidoreductase
MNIGIIGAGNVGGTLGARWARNGHAVAFGVRDPNSTGARELLQKAGSGTATTMADAAKSADVLLVSTPWGVTKQVLEGLGDLSGKIVIDATNPLLPDLSGLSLGTTTSAAEQVAQWASGARVVKAFNTVGFNIMADPSFGASRALLFYCGDDAAAKQTVKSLAAELGFDPEDAGPLRQARLIEPFALLWISLAYGQGYGREFAFQLLRR